MHEVRPEIDSDNGERLSAVAMTFKGSPSAGRTEGLGVPQPNPDGKGMRGPRSGLGGGSAQRSVNQRALAWFRQDLALDRFRQSPDGIAQLVA